LQSMIREGSCDPIAPLRTAAWAEEMEIQRKADPASHRGNIGRRFIKPLVLSQGADGRDARNQ
jgi:hypothetical protein